MGISRNTIKKWVNQKAILRYERVSSIEGDARTRAKVRKPVIEQIAKLEREMSQVHTKYRDAENQYGSELLNMVLAKGYMAKLQANETVKNFVDRRDPDILEHFEMVVKTVIMEEALQQKEAHS